MNLDDLSHKYIHLVENPKAGPELNPYTIIVAAFEKEDDAIEFIKDAQHCTIRPISLYETKKQE